MSQRTDADALATTNARWVPLSRLRWTNAAGVASSVGLSLALFFLYQRAAFGDILSLSERDRPAPDPWLFPAALVSTTLVLLAPGMALSGVLNLARRHRAARHFYLAWSGGVMLLSLIDLNLLTSVGRHVTEIAALALQPNMHVAGGNAWGWVQASIKCVAAALGLTVAITLATQWLVGVVTACLTPLLRRAVGVAFCIASSMFVAAPILLLQAWGNHPVVERLYASVLLDVRPGHGASDGTTTLDPRLGGLYPRLQRAYKAAFPALTAGKPEGTETFGFTGRPPNVVLIVTESFRFDAFEPGLMPKLSRWAQDGLVATHHDASTIYSQSGAFALLYGRSTATFHQTLDANVPPPFCATLRRSGYECAYFTGHPKVWLRREDFLNERTMDHFVHDDRGTWAEWDRRALDGMVDLVRDNPKPVFAIVLLMSSHFEYRYPPEYGIDHPVSESVWHVTTDTLGADAELPLRNRYRNCMRFIDDLVAEAIGRLDPERNLIVFTGDHGESINDDGHYTHGYSFAEILTRTPFAMVGPGVPPTRIDAPTSHVDVLPTVLHALTGQRPALARVHGIDWLAGERHDAMLEAHSPVNKERVETQLRVGGRRLRIDLDLTRPAIKVLGFEDELGRLAPTPELSEREVDEIASAFDDQLSSLRR